MRYKLIGSNNKNDIVGTVLQNRGISDVNAYLNCTKSERKEDWKLLDDIDKGVELFDKHFKNRDKIAILVDNDTDGICSGTLAFKYIKDLDNNYPVELVVHSKQKSHGLCEDFQLPDDTKLLWIPDASTNDYKQCVELLNNGTDVLITDHHEASEDGWMNIKYTRTVIINNQTSLTYPNKSFCGCSVTAEFCRALDEFYWTDYTEKYMDLIAVADIADVMSLKDIATRREVNLGLQNINNKMLKEIIKAQDFSMKGIVSPFTVSFYVAPLINSFIRMASTEEKALLIRAFCEDEAETFDYKKRGTTEIVKENIYQHCVRLMKSYKGKQDRQKDKGVEALQKKIEKNFKHDKVIVCDCTDELDSALTGLVAIKIAEKFNKPTLLLRRMADNPDVFGGSGRAFNYCPIDDFRAFVESCPFTGLAQGHAGAFGYEVAAKNIELSKQWFNEQLTDMDFSKVYTVDFEIDADDMDFFICKEVDQYKTLWAKEVDEPLFAITGLEVNNKTARICGKNNDTIQITWEDNPVKYVQFKVGEGNPLYDWLNNNWDDTATVTLNIVGTLELSTYEGVTSGQVNIKDLEIVE